MLVSIKTSGSPIENQYDSISVFCNQPSCLSSSLSIIQSINLTINKLVTYSIVISSLFSGPKDADLTYADQGKFDVYLQKMFIYKEKNGHTESSFSTKVNQGRVTKHVNE